MCLIVSSCIQISKGEKLLFSRRNNGQKLPGFWGELSEKKQLFSRWNKGHKLPLFGGETRVKTVVLMVK